MQILVKKTAEDKERQREPLEIKLSVREISRKMLISVQKLKALVFKLKLSK